MRERGDLAWAAAGLFVAGEVSAIVAAAAGLLAYFTIPAHSEEAHPRMLIHGVLAGSAVLVFSIVVVSRWKRRKVLPTKTSLVLAILAACLLTAAGALGGHLVFRDGVGVKPDGQGHHHGHVH